MDLLKQRSHPRVAVETLCSEVVAEREQYSLIVDLSESGLRLQRPLRGRNESRIIQLEFELPEADEIVWAKGEICFDQLWHSRAEGQGPASSIRTSGVRLVAAASRHLRMLRDWVVATREARARDDEFDMLTRAAHWSG